MAENNNGALLFGIRLDNSQLVKDIELSHKLFDSLSLKAEETGKNISEYFRGLQLGIGLDNKQLSEDVQQANKLFDSIKKNQGKNVVADSLSDNDKLNNIGDRYKKILTDIYIAAGNTGSKIREESAQVANSVGDDMNKLNNGFNALSGLAGKMFLGISAKEIAGQMFSTRSYFQDAESTMKVFLGDADKGTKFFRELKDYAFYNMFEFKDLVGASKQLISYGTAAEDVTGVLDKLSNIATGTGANLNDMIGMYNKAKSIGKVDSQGLESWAARGVLVKDVLKEMGEQVGSTGVTFAQLEKVLAKVTGEGGMFHDLMKEQLNNLSASYAQLQDNLTSMWAELGENAEPYMKGAIDLAGTLVENYQNIADVVIDVAKVYGAYKVTDMSMGGFQNIQSIIEQATAEKVLAETDKAVIETFKQHGDEIEKLLTADQAYNLSLSGLEKGTDDYARAVKTMFEEEKESTAGQLENITRLHDATEKKLDVLNQEYELTKKKADWAERDNNLTKSAILTEKAEALQEEILATKKELNNVANRKEEISTKAAAAAKRQDTLATMQSAVATNSAATASTIFSKTTTVLTAGVKKLGAVLKSTVLSNPYALAIAAAVALANAIYDIVTAESLREQAEATATKAQAEAYKKTIEEINKLNVALDFAPLEKLKPGVEGYEEAIQKLLTKYPELDKAVKENGMNLNDYHTQQWLLKEGYDMVTESIYQKNLAAANENQIAENNNSLSEKQTKMLEEFKEAMEDMDFDDRKIAVLGEEYRKALMKGMKLEEMPKEVQQVFEEYKGGIGERILDFFSLGNFLNRSNEESWSAYMKQDTKNLVGAADDSYQKFNTTLIAHQKQLENQASAIADVNAEMQDQIDKVKELKQETEETKEWTFNPILKELQDKQKGIKEQMEALTIEDVGYEDMDKDLAENKKRYVENLQKQYNDLSEQIKKYQKRIFGDPAGEKAAYKKSLDLFKSFASEYTKIEIQRQNDIEKLNKKRDSQGANQDIIDIEIGDIQKKADDDLTILMAKYYKVSNETAEKVKTAFQNALSMPVEKAQTRLAELTTDLQKIADGKKTVSRDKMAEMQAEQAGLQQNISKSYEREDYSEKTKKYESFYDELAKIAEEKQKQLNEIEKRFKLGLISEEELNTVNSNINTAFSQQANIIAQEYGMSVEDISQSVIDGISTTTDTAINETITNIEKLKQSVTYLEGELANGVDILPLLTQTRTDLENATDELISMLSTKMSFLANEIAITTSNIQALQARAAKGKDVSVELAKQEQKLKGLKSQWEQYRSAQQSTEQETVKLTDNQQKMLDIMSNQAKWKKARKYYDSARDGLNNVLDATDGISDETKEVINSMMDMGQGLFDLVGQLQQFALDSCKAVETAGIAAAEGVKTAEKGSVILAVIGAAIQAVMTIVKIFNKHGRTAKANEQIEKLDGQIHDLQRQYDKLGDSIDNAYGSDATPLIEQQDKLLAQQEQLIRQQIEAEKSKRNKKQDVDQIKEWEEQLEDIAATRGKKQETLVEKMIGKDYKSVLEDFSGDIMSAMDDAETSVDDAVKNVGKSIKKLAVQQQLNAKLQPLAEEYANTLSDAMSDGVLDESEKKVLEGLENNIASVSEKYLGQFDDLWDKAEEEADARQGASGGIQNMSQDTAEEMNGRLTQIQSHTFSISENVKQMREFSSQSLIYLSAISTNTLTAAKNSSAILGILSNVERVGVKLKS